MSSRWWGQFFFSFLSRSLVLGSSSLVAKSFGTSRSISMPMCTATVGKEPVVPAISLQMWSTTLTAPSHRLYSGADKGIALPWPFKSLSQSFSSFKVPAPRDTIVCNSLIALIAPEQMDCLIQILIQNMEHTTFREFLITLDSLIENYGSDSIFVRDRHLHREMFEVPVWIIILRPLFPPRQHSAIRALKRNSLYIGNN